MRPGLASGLFGFENRQLVNACLTQRTQLLLNDVLNSHIVHGIVLVAENVAESANIAPRNVWLSLFDGRSKFLRGFADPFETPLDCVSRLLVELSSGCHSLQVRADSVDVGDDVSEPLDRNIRRHRPLAPLRSAERAAEACRVVLRPHLGQQSVQGRQPLPRMQKNPLQDLG